MIPPDCMNRPPPRSTPGRGGKGGVDRQRTSIVRILSYWPEIFSTTYFSLLEIFFLTVKYFLGWKNSFLNLENFILENLYSLFSFCAGNFYNFVFQIIFAISFFGIFFAIIKNINILLYIIIFIFIVFIYIDYILYKYFYIL